MFIFVFMVSVLMLVEFLLEYKVLYSSTPEWLAPQTSIARARAIYLELYLELNPEFNDTKTTNTSKITTRKNTKTINTKMNTGSC